MNLKEMVSKYGDFERQYLEERRDESFEDWFINRYLDHSPAIHIGSICLGDGRYCGGVAVIVDEEEAVFIPSADGFMQVNDYVDFIDDNGWRASSWWKYDAKDEDRLWVADLIYKLRKEMKSNE